MKDITDCIQSGKTTFEEIQASTLIGSSCPPCLETSKQHFETIKQSFIEELNTKTP
ncbi:MAG: hypothetical protein K9L26_02380 [Candidatus Izimaplasma sp.]|nr:hypothetical protein [Candidatus Izimaplasma bacterium]